MNTMALQDVWQTILGYKLTAANKRWIADHLYEQAEKEEGLPLYTMEELDARIEEAERQVAAGELIDGAVITQELRNKAAMRW